MKVSPAVRLCFRTGDPRTGIYARMTYALVFGDAVVTCITFACLQVAFAALAVFKVFTAALFFALVVDAFFVFTALAVARAASRNIDASVVFDFLARSAARNFFALAVSAFFVGGAVGIRRALRLRRYARIAHAVGTVSFFGLCLIRAAGCFVSHFGARFQDARSVFAFFAVIAIGIRRTFIVASITLLAVCRRSRRSLFFPFVARRCQSHIRAAVFNTGCAAQMPARRTSQTNRFVPRIGRGASRTFCRASQTFARREIQIIARVARFSNANAVLQFVSRFAFVAFVRGGAFYAICSARIAFAVIHVQILPVFACFQNAFSVNQIIGGFACQTLSFRACFTIRRQVIATAAVVVNRARSVGAGQFFTISGVFSAVDAFFIVGAICIDVACDAQSRAAGYFFVGASALFARGTNNALQFSVFGRAFERFAARSFRAGAIIFVSAVFNRAVGRARNVGAFDAFCCFPFVAQGFAESQFAVLTRRALSIFFTDNRTFAIGIICCAAQFFCSRSATRTNGNAGIPQLDAAGDDKRFGVV